MVFTLALHIVFVSIHIFTGLSCYTLSFDEERRRLLETGIIPSYTEKHQTAFEEIEEANDSEADVDRFYEGDIELNMSDEVQYQGQRKSIMQHNNELWPKSNKDGLVYIPFVYEPGIIDIGDDTKKTLQDVFEFFEQRTCIRFKENSSSESPLTIYKGDGCHSTIGKHDDGALLSLGDDCGKSRDVKHELMHVLGFFHEQSRMDRDNYVMIRTDNIQPGKEISFGKYQNGKTLDFPYDKHSIMHYSRNTFSRSPNVQSIVSLKDPTEQLGGSDLSLMDIEKINQMYDCTNYKDDEAFTKDAKKNVAQIGVGFSKRNSLNIPPPVERTIGNFINNKVDSIKRFSNLTLSERKQQFVNSTTSNGSASNLASKQNGANEANRRSENSESVINEIIFTNNIDRNKVIHDLEGDMDVDLDEVGELFDGTNTDIFSNKRLLLRNRKRFWKKVGKVVPIPFQFAKGRFKITENLKRKFFDIFEVFHQKTCIRFEERPNAYHAVTIVVNGDDGCRSKIGYHSNGGEIIVGRNCNNLPILRHEIMHALGFLHEHSRRDRDKFVKVFEKNIQQHRAEFLVRGFARTLDTPYDKQSIMHYHSTAFSKDGKRLATIVSLSNPDEILGNENFSSLDIDKVNIFYECNKKTNYETNRKYRYDGSLAGTSDTDKEDDEGGGHRFG